MNQVELNGFVEDLGDSVERLILVGLVSGCYAHGMEAGDIAVCNELYSFIEENIESLPYKKPSKTAVRRIRGVLTSKLAEYGLDWRKLSVESKAQRCASLPTIPFMVIESEGLDEAAEAHDEPHIEAVEFEPEDDDGDCYDDGEEKDKSVGVIMPTEEDVVATAQKYNMSDDDARDMLIKAYNHPSYDELKGDSFGIGGFEVAIINSNFTICPSTDEFIALAEMYEVQIDEAIKAYDLLLRENFDSALDRSVERATEAKYTLANKEHEIAEKLSPETLKSVSEAVMRVMSQLIEGELDPRPFRVQIRQMLPDNSDHDVDVYSNYWFESFGVSYLARTHTMSALDELHSNLEVAEIEEMRQHIARVTQSELMAREAEACSEDAIYIERFAQYVWIKHYLFLDMLGVSNARNMNEANLLADVKSYGLLLDLACSALPEAIARRDYTTTTIAEESELIMGRKKNENAGVGVDFGNTVKVDNSPDKIAEKTKDEIGAKSPLSTPPLPESKSKGKGKLGDGLVLSNPSTPEKEAEDRDAEYIKKLPITLQDMIAQARSELEAGLYSVDAGSKVSFSSKAQGFKREGIREHGKLSINLAPHMKMCSQEAVLRYLTVYESFEGTPEKLVSAICKDLWIVLKPEKVKVKFVMERSGVTFTSEDEIGVTLDT